MRSFNKFNHPLTDGSVKKRYKMYKSKKHWVYSALLFLGTGAVVATSGGIAKADVVTASSVPETSASRSTGDLTSSATSSSEESSTTTDVTTPEATAIAAADNQSTQSAVIQFKDESGSILKETTISGESGAAVSESLFAADYQSMLQAGYVLAAAGDGTIGQVFDDDAAVAQTFVITLQKVEATTPASATGTTAAVAAESTATAATTATTTSAAAVEATADRQATAKLADATTTAPITETTDAPAEVNAAEKVTAEGSVTPADSTENTTPSVLDSQTEEAVSTVETTELANSGQFPAGTAITVLDHVLNVALPTDTSLTATQQQLLEHFALNNKLTVSVAQLAPSAQSKIMLASSTKTYDNQTQTPVSYTVQLSPDLVAPTSWYESGTVDSYITIDPTDVDTSSVSQNVGTYAVTLTASGLAKVQAANPTATLTLGDVTAGTVEIKQAIVPSSTIWIVSQEKDYDNDATNAPTTYQVKLPTYLTAPTVVTEVPGTVITPPAIPGYTVKPGQEPKVPETTGEATKIVYTANPQTAVIHFVTKEGTVIQVPITVTGVSDGVVEQAEIEAVIQQLTSQGYTLISNTAKNAVFDHDDTNTQAFVVTFANKVTTPVDDKTPAKPNGGADTGTPTVPNTQGDNATPSTGISNGSGTPTNGVTPTSNKTVSAATQNTQAARMLLADTNAASKRKLPNTGEEKASGLSILGAIAVGFAGLIGLGKKKKED